MTLYYPYEIAAVTWVSSVKGSPEGREPSDPCTGECQDYMASHRSVF